MGAVGMRLISAKGILRLGTSSLDWQKEASGVLSKVMPSERLRSELRNRTLLRHAEGLLSIGCRRSKPTVSPNAVSIWPLPLSHMMPRSVPRTLVSWVRLALSLPVSCATTWVRPRSCGTQFVLLNSGIGFAFGSADDGAARAIMDIAALASEPKTRALGEDFLGLTRYTCCVFRAYIYSGPTYLQGLHIFRAYIASGPTCLQGLHVFRAYFPSGPSHPYSHE